MAQAAFLGTVQLLRNADVRSQSVDQPCNDVVATGWEDRVSGGSYTVPDICILTI